MHDKEATQERFTKRLQKACQNVEVTYFYPTMHYANRPVPAAVQAIAQPLDLDLVAEMDGFIVTGAPLEQKDFTEITYWDELVELFDFLSAHHIEQLYVCWGAMAAANYFYNIEKDRLPQKVFGVYQNKILQPTALTEGLSFGFKAPHARYADLNVAQIMEEPDLTLTGISQNGHVFSFEALEQQTFLLAHLEYQAGALEAEYQREKAAFPNRDIAQPENVQTSWEETSRIFYRNWLEKVAHQVAEKELCYE